MNSEDTRHHAAAQKLWLAHLGGTVDPRASRLLEREWALLEEEWATTPAPVANPQTKHAEG